MALDLAALNIPIRTGSKRAERELKGLNRVGVGVGKSLVRAFLPLVAIFGAGRLLKGFFKLNIEFEQLRTNLHTITGSAETAAQAMAGLQKFAVETPFQLQELTRAYTKLLTLGLSPTTEELTDLGNVAAGWGETMESMADAIAGATVGISTSMRRFGIITRIEGDKVTLIYNGISRTVKRTAQDIANAVGEIGRESFAGGMKRQAETMAGVLQRIEDAIAVIATQFGEGLMPLFKDLGEFLGDFSEALARNKTALIEWGEALAASFRLAASLLSLNFNMLSSNTVLPAIAAWTAFRDLLIETKEAFLAPKGGGGSGGLPGDESFEGVELPDIFAFGDFFSIIPKMQTTGVEMIRELQMTWADAFRTMFDAIANVIATGNGSIESAMLGGLGAIMGQLGDALITAGLAMMGLNAALANPFTSGPAMLAAGGILKVLGATLTGIANQSIGASPVSPGLSAGGGGGPVGSTTNINLTPGAGGGFVPTGASGGMNQIIVIGPNDPSAQRDLFRLLNNGAARGLSLA